MHNNKFLMRLINYFLPIRSKVMEIDEYKTLAILEADIDKDGEEEVLCLYTRSGSNYLIVLKKIEYKWYVIWNNQIRYQSVNTFQVVNLSYEYRQIILGGKLEGEEGDWLTLLNWKQGNLQEITNKPLAFDKIYIQDIDGEDGLDEIALWRHRELEAYDINLYSYQQETLMQDTSLDPYYFKMIVNYYQYLHDTYPQESIYEEYLEEAKRRCNKESESITYTATMLREEESDEVLIATTGYIVNQEEEEEIFLWGKQQQVGEVHYIMDLKLIVTTQNKSKYQVISLGKNKIYDYQLFVGDFTGNGVEDIWVGINEGKWYIGVYSFEGEEINQIFNSREWEEEKSALSKEIVEIYPVDRGGYEIYEICYIEENNQGEQWMTWVNWDNGELVPYEKYSIQR